MYKNVTNCYLFSCFLFHTADLTQDLQRYNEICLVCLPVYMAVMDVEVVWPCGGRVFGSSPILNIFSDYVSKL